MTKEETVKILAMLGSFYDGGRNDPQIQAAAWHKILGKYDYQIASIAVLKFAENDTRDYATFPAVGKIVEAIKDEEYSRMKPIYDIKMSISHGRKYDEMSPKCRSIIGREMYDTWLDVDAEEFELRSDEFMGILKSEYSRKLIAGI